MNAVRALAECCGPRLLSEPLSREEADALAGAIRVLADPARLQVLSLIAARPGGEACVCHLTAPLGLSQPTVSHHLRVLYDAGLLAREPRGRWVHYRIEPDVLAGLRAGLPPPSQAAAS